MCANASQMEGPRPLVDAAPSTWYADVAVPNTNPLGNDARLSPPTPLAPFAPAAPALATSSASSTAHRASISSLPATAQQWAVAAPPASAAVGRQ